MLTPAHRFLHFGDSVLQLAINPHAVLELAEMTKVDGGVDEVVGEGKDDWRCRRKERSGFLLMTYNLDDINHLREEESREVDPSELSSQSLPHAAYLTVTHPLTRIWW